jgi:hypothetical protein
VRPVLCLWDKSFAPLGRYVVEMLQAEGLTGASDRDVSASRISARDLDGRQAIIVAPCAPDSGAEASALEALRGGAAIVFLRPSRQTAATLGLTARTERVANEFYIAPDRSHPLWFAALGDFLQFHGGADLYDRCDDVLAWIAGANWAMPNPAIVTGTFGDGRYAVFTYDLATSTVLFHQGLPDLASTGARPDADGDGVFAPNDLFQGFLDVNLRHVPQADLQQRLLVRVLEWASEPRGPLTRLWTFPNAEPAVVLINGDSDLMTRPQLDWFINMTEAHGGGYTIYLLEEHRPLVPPELEADYRRRGHSAGPHIWLKLKPTPDEMAARIHQEVADFTLTYGHPPRTTRHHCVVWPGWVETARALAGAGVRLETNYRAAERYQSGYLTGSGLPMRFVDESGEMIDCFQQETLLCDDYALIDKSFLPPLSEEQVIALSRRLIDDARQRYHTAVQIYFHPVYSTGLTVHTGQFIHTAGWLEAVLKYSRRTGTLIPSTDTWWLFCEQRRTTMLGESRWDPSTGALAVNGQSATGLAGGSIVLPTDYAGLRLHRVTLGLDELPIRVREGDGREHALATGDIAPGDFRLVASYR